MIDIFKKRNLYGIVLIPYEGSELLCDDKCDKHDVIEYYFGARVDIFKKIYSNVWTINNDNKVRKERIKDLVEEEKDVIVNGVRYSKVEIRFEIRFDFSKFRFDFSKFNQDTMKKIVNIINK